MSESAAVTARVHQHPSHWTTPSFGPAERPVGYRHGGPPELFVEKLTAFAETGVQRVFIGPVADELRQLDRFANQVRPIVAST